MGRKVLIFLAVAVLWVGDAARAAVKCPSDSVPVGQACVDKYEVSVWEIPATNKALIKKVQKGKATFADLLAGGASQRGLSCVPDDYPCGDNGNDCAEKIFAVSIPGVKPSTCITWFQAQQACGNAGKRLLTNAEWQLAVAGTADPGENNGLANTKCNTTGGSTRNTGNAGATPGGTDSCISARGVEDMVGNAWEWVADWVPQSLGCVTGGAYGDGDLLCFSGANQGAPGALVRGGDFNDGSGAGVFAISGGLVPWIERREGNDLGFRCAR
jgi:formylglycine-generating enzyme required for sulfatase activity